MIPYGRQEITDADIEAVVSVLKSDYLTQGPKVPEFEQAVTDYCGAEHGVAVNSGTSALHVACLALGVTGGDIVWTTPITFVASSNCALYCGAKIDFVDIDPLTANMSIAALKTKLQLAAEQKKLPKVVIPVHLCGHSCKMDEIKVLSEQYGFSVIEDACHALGGRYQDSPIGCCRYSDITVFSFHPVKIITTAEGGMAVTNSAGLAGKMMSYRSHGITRDPDKMTHEIDGPWYYQQIDLGYNYRLTDIQAALGISQLSRLDDVVARRHRLADRYNVFLQDLPLLLPYQMPSSFSSFHLYVIRLQVDQIRLSHNEVFDALRHAGIGVNIHYIPVHTQPYYQQYGFRTGDFPEAEKYYEEVITLPLYHHLTEEEQDKVINSLRDIIK